MEKMMSNPYETFVRWYLRFNGYFCIENFVLHQTLGRSIIQAGEFDVLAVRFPHSRENKTPGMQIENDHWLALNSDLRIPKDCLGGSRVDFVIAEVKAGRGSVNEVWQRPDPEQQKVARIEYLLRWMGPLDSEGATHRVALELQQKQCSCHENFIFRVLGFCREKPNSESAGIPQLTFAEIARWIVTARTPSWRDLGFGARSAHDQWDPMIKEIWEAGNPKVSLDVDERVTQILAILDKGQTRDGG
jgi:hypothetical protein